MSVEVNHRPDMPSRPLFQAFIPGNSPEIPMLSPITPFIPSLYSRQLSRNVHAITHNILYSKPLFQTFIPSLYSRPLFQSFIPGNSLSGLE